MVPGFCKACKQCEATRFQPAFSFGCAQSCHGDSCLCHLKTISLQEALDEATPSDNSQNLAGEERPQCVSQGEKYIPGCLPVMI